jgi:hypothetical protein
MFQSPQSQQQEPFAEVRNGLNWMLLIANAGATSVEVFLHRRFGARYLGFQAMAAVPLILIFALYWPQTDIDPLMVFLLAYLGMCMVARLGMMLRTDVEHSYYSGWPHLLSPKAAGKELFFKQFVEPAFVIFGGVLVRDWNDPLGAYLTFAGCCLFISNTLNRMAASQRVMNVRDAMYEQQQLAETLRGIRVR